MVREHKENSQMGDEGMRPSGRGRQVEGQWLDYAHVKDSNPKDGIGATKAPLSTLSMPVIYEMALAMLDGACKYRRHNYRIAGVRLSVYYDAALRHINKWWEGEDLDLDYVNEAGETVIGSGLPHLAHAMACLMIIRDGQLTGLATDDRPPETFAAGWLDEHSRKAAEIIAKYDGGKLPYIRGDEIVYTSSPGPQEKIIGVKGDET